MIDWLSVRPSRALVALALVACQSKAVTGPELVGSGRAVLFVGNSLTYANDLPGIVQAMADSTGESIAVETWAGADMALIDHWNEGQVQKEIAKRSWAFVVLQQGPSSVEANRDTLRMAASLFAPKITNAGAQPVLFSVWPTSDRRQDFPRAIESYRLAAADVKGVYAPVAAGWLAAWQRDSTLQFYTDGLHPSEAGSYLAALVLYARILGKSPLGLPATLRLRDGYVVRIPQATATLLQQAAADALTDAG